MRKQDIAKILLVLCAMMPVASMSFAGDKPLSPDDVPSECNKKNGSVIDVSTLRKRIAATPKKTSTWIDSTYGFQFVYPSGLRPSHQFEATYLQPGNWSYFSTKDNGRRLVSIKLPTTPQKTTVADIRIGVSTDPAVVSQCRELPANADQKSLKTFKNNDIVYTYFTAKDAAMSKSIDVEAYRTVHQNRCYSVELMVNAIDPSVQSPPDKDAMKPELAMKRLNALWRQMDFKWLP